MRFGLLVPVIAVAAAVAPAPAAAAQIRPFDARAFAEAQQAGRPILVDVYADWCTVCRAQQRVMAKLLPRDEFKNLVVFKLNFDKQEKDWKRFGVRRQSTLIVFRGRKEVGRSVAVTDGRTIERLLRSSLRG